MECESRGRLKRVAEEDDAYRGDDDAVGGGGGDGARTCGTTNQRNED